MAAKSKTADKPEEKLARKNLVLEITEDETEESKAERNAKLLTSPEFAAYRVINSADGKAYINDIDAPSFVNELRTQAAAANRGDFTQAESMLMNQATALQHLFARLTERAMTQEHMPNLEGYMRMALRAQNQCRATLETLAAIKNPPVIFAKQANINQGSGNQQVNNGTPATDTLTFPRTHTHAHAQAGKNINQQNGLLEAQHGERMDSGKTGKTIRKDKAMATLG